MLRPMNATAVPARPRGLASLASWPRVRFAVGLSGAIGLLFSFNWESGAWSVISRAILLGLVAMITFGILEQWPRRLPRRLARWVLQVVGVALVIPFTTWTVYQLSTAPGAPPFWQESSRLQGFGTLTVLGVLVAPWAALAALVRQKEALARQQALELSLVRSELDRRSLDARLRLLQAQVAPHFLFNTLANVQALVDSGSPRASVVLRSLVAYLRAAVPRLDEPATTLGQELELVRAYLELMHMRMPDRLRFDVVADPDVLGLRCPPMTLLTLVENAVRHGIDPSEEGGTIEIRVRRAGDRCEVRVSDTGAGPRGAGEGLGTGLAALRERLTLVFGEGARLRVGAQSPRGVLAEVEFPALGGPS